MSERDRQIIELAQRGLSASKIKSRLGLSITLRSVQRVIVRELPPRPDNRNSGLYAINPNFMPHIKECLRRLGKDSHFCEICEEKQEVPCDIHHTKYEGATIYDLQYVCRSCNLSYVNTGLA